MRTATATVGIRGTDYVAIVIPPDGQQSLPPGTYVTVTQGAVGIIAGGAEQLVGAGQTGFSSSSNLPARLIPPPPELPTVTPPQTVSSAGGTTTISSRTGDLCIE
jgi:hypothetical protein